MMYTDGWKYRLERDEHFPPSEILASYLGPVSGTTNHKRSVTLGPIRLGDAGSLRVSKGYMWDGASGPTKDTKSSMRASLFHDAMYQLIRRQKYPVRARLAVDQYFRDLCIEDGMWEWRANLWCRALARWGGSSITPASIKEIHSTTEIPDIREQDKFL